MEPLDSNPIQITPEPAPKKRANKAVILVLLVAVTALIVGAGYVVWKNNIPEQNKAVTPSSTTSMAVPATQSAPPVHFVQAVGYPFDVNKKVIFNLGLPSSLQGVVIQSTIQNPGYTTYLTNKFNDELARFTIGNPKLPNATREVSLIALGKEWSSSTTEKPDMLEFEDLSTPAKKQQYIANLSPTTRTCIEDSKKGFRTKDKTLSVCYTLTTGKDGWSPLVTLKGYGTIEGTPIVLLGYIDLNEDKTISEAEDLKLREEAFKGNFPESTKKLLADVIDALSQSTITTTNR